MAIHRPTRAGDSKQVGLLDELIQRKGLQPGDYALFFVTGEGRYLPPGRGPALSGSEEKSGFTVNRQGEIYYFWLGWDPACAEPALVEWKLVQPEPFWLEDEEYRQARSDVGLPAA